jgi:dTDP-L-rhamnose 4-epimerase
VQGFVQDYETMRAALTDLDVVFHEAAYGGYMPEMAKYVLVNSFGTAQMLEIIRDHNLPVRKVVVASSQAVYSEGAARCPEHGEVFPLLRPAEQLRAGDFSVHCPICGEVTVSIATPEAAPVGGETVYGLTKVDQEKLVLLWGKQTGIPTVALRYSCTYGPRQSLFNPYTGVNAGSGRATSVRDLAAIIADQLGIKIEPLARGEFRPGEIRSLISDISRIRTIGYEPQVTIEQGIGRYIEWIKTQGPVEDYFAQAEAGLRAKGIVQSVKG